jgi:hypothetical protein
MKDLFRKHIDEFLIAFAIVLAVGMVASFVWGVTYISMSINSALNFKPAPQQNTNFDIPDAAKLDLKGLVQP